MKYSKRNWKKAKATALGQAFGGKLKASRKLKKLIKVYRKSCPGAYKSVCRTGRMAVKNHWDLPRHREHRCVKVNYPFAITTLDTTL